MGDIKKTIAFAITAITVLGVISSSWFLSNQALKVYNNPDTLPEVTEDIIEKEIVEPIERKVNLIVLIANFITSLPAPILLLLLFAYAYISKN